MKEYSKYIFKKILTPTLLTISTITLLIWLIQIIKFIPYVTEKGLELTVFLKMVIFVIPSLLLIIIPISIFTSSIFMYNKLIFENELVVLKGAGLSKISLFKPLFRLSLIFTLVCYILSLYLIPFAEHSYTDIKNYAKKNYITLLLSEGEFNHIPSENITLYTKENKNGILKEILLYNNQNSEKPSIITAESGVLVESRESNDESIYLQMKNGNVTNFLESTDTDKADSTLYFQDYTINLSDYYEVDIKANNYKIVAVSTMDLIKGIETNIQDSSKYKTELHKRLTMPLLPLILSILGIGGLLYGDFNRRGNAKNIRFTLIAGGLYLGSMIYMQNSIEAKPERINTLYIYIVLTFVICVFLLINNRKLNIPKKIKFIKNFIKNKNK